MLKWILTIIISFLAAKLYCQEIVLPLTPSREIKHLVLSKDKELMFVADEEDVFIFQMKTRRLLKVIEAVFPKGVFVSPNDQTFTICHHTQADVYSCNSFDILYSLKGVDYEVSQAAYSHNGGTIAITGTDNKVVLFNLGNGSQMAEFKDSHYLESPVFSKNDSLIKVATNNNRTIVWNLYNKKKVLDTCLCDYAYNYAKLDSLGLRPLYFPTYNRDTTLLLLKDTLIIARNLSEETIKLSDEGKYLLSVHLEKKPDSLTSKFVSDSSYSYDFNSKLLAWDYITGKQLISLPVSLRVPGFIFVSDTTIAYPASKDVLLFNLPSGTKELLFKREIDAIRDAHLSNSKNLIVAETFDNELKIWNVYDGSFINSFKPFKETMNYAADTAQTIFVFNQRFSSRLFITPLKDSGNLSYYDNDPAEGDITSAAVSADGKFIAFGTRAGAVNLLNNKNEKVFSVSKKDDCCYIENINISADNKDIVAAHNKAEGWNLVNKNQIPDDSLTYLKSILTDPLARPAIYNSSLGNTCMSYNMTYKGKDIEVKWYSFKNGGYLILLPDGYYFSTKDAASEINYRKGKDLISFAQLDIQFNRPDKVLQVLTSAAPNFDQRTIGAYKKAWQKRIQRLNMDTSLFTGTIRVPKADFQKAENIEPVQKDSTLRLSIRAEDTVSFLGWFNIWINEIPVYGVRGIDLRSRHLHYLDTTVTVILSSGNNRIETSVINLTGAESYRTPLHVKYLPPLPRPEKIYFAGIGIDKFNESGYNLQYSVKDIRNLSEGLHKKYGDNIVIDTLFNQNVTVTNIKALKKKLLQTTVNDKVIIAYSGHGLLNKAYDYYLSTYNISFDKPEKNGLPYEELEDLIDSIPARKKLMLIDACHSGEVDKEELVTIHQKAASLGLKGVEIANYKKDDQIGLKNSFELMQELFVNVGRSTGATIISAAAGTQFALERGDLQNGVFTYSILEAMQQHQHINVGELKKIVTEQVVQLTNGLQKPTSRNETIDVNWDVW